MIKKDSLIPLIFGIISISFVFLGDPDFVYSITREDGLIENLTAVFYMIALIFSFISIFKGKPIFLPLTWAILCFIFLGEETSWFQRVFDFSVPTVENINAQNEFNLHNLKIFEGGSLLDNPITLKTFVNSQNLFRMGFFGYFILLPLITSWENIKNIFLKLGYHKPSNAFTLALFLIFFLSFSLAIHAQKINLRSSLSEIREMLYAFFIMAYTIYYIWMNRIKTSFNKLND